MKLARLTPLLGALAGGRCSRDVRRRTVRARLPPASSDAQYSALPDRPGDNVQIFVWRNPEYLGPGAPGWPVVGAAAPKKSPAAGKTPAELARDLEAELSTYLRDPLVTVIVDAFVRTREQIVSSWEGDPAAGDAVQRFDDAAGRDDSVRG